MSNPRANPFTSWVLPAPRSPESPITSPLCALRPHSSPSDSVSAGLFEMYVAMGTQSPNSILIAQRNPLPGDDFTNATQRHIGKLFLPTVQHRHRIRTANSK